MKIKKEVDAWNIENKNGDVIIQLVPFEKRIIILDRRWKLKENASKDK